jgi:hypothetical protein
VRKSGKVPEVKLRERSDKTNYAANRASANFSSTGQPVRLPRKTKKSDFEAFSYLRLPQKPLSDLSKESYSPSKRSQSVTEKYYFGNPLTVKQTPGGLNRSYSSVQNLNKRSPRPEHHQSAGNIYKVTARGEEPQQLSSRRRGSEDSNQVRNSSGDHKSSTERESRDGHQPKNSSREIIKQRYPGDSYQLRKTSGDLYTSKQRGSVNTNQVRNISGELSSRQSVPKNNVHSGRQKVSGDEDQDRPGMRIVYSSRKPNIERSRVHHLDKKQNERNTYTDQPKVRKPYPRKGKEYNSEPQEKSAIYSTPHRIIYTMDAPVGSPSTKYRTRIVINGDGL